MYILNLNYKQFSQTNRDVRVNPQSTIVWKYKSK